LVESLENILQGLNENQTLLTLDISGNDLDEDLSTLKFKITNETLQKLIEYVKEFIKLNTPVTSIRFWNLNVDFSQELKLNHNLIDCGGETLWSRYYLEEI
jgi:hypothetical protein